MLNFDRSKLGWSMHRVNLINSETEKFEWQSEVCRFETGNDDG